MFIQRRRVFLAFAVVGAAFFLLNLLTPLYADDFSYCFTFTVGEKLRVTDLSLLLRSQLGHYQYVNGRSIAHTLAQLFLMWGKPIFNVINTFAFLTLCWVMQALMTGKRRFSLSLFLFSVAGLWFVTPAFGQDFLWLTASCTYLYALLLILFYLLLFRRAWDENVPGGGLRALAFFLFGVLAGWTQENASVALIIMVMCFTIAFWRSGSLKGWMITGLMGNLTGLALLLLAPGQSVRLAGVGGMGGLILWLQRGLSITARAGYYLWIPAILFLGMFVWRLKTEGGPLSFKTYWHKWFPTTVFFLGSLVSTYAMILSPVFPRRAWSCVVIFSLIAVGNLAVLCPDLRLPRPACVAVCAAMFVLAAVTYVQAVFSLYKTSRSVAEREAIIQEALNWKESIVTLDPIYGDNRYNCFGSGGDLVTDSGKWPNTAIAMYYGLETVHSAQENIGQNIEGSEKDNGNKK